MRSPVSIQTKIWLLTALSPSKYVQVCTLSFAHIHTCMQSLFLLALFSMHTVSAFTKYSFQGEAAKWKRF